MPHMKYKQYQTYTVLTVLITIPSAAANSPLPCREGARGWVGPLKDSTCRHSLHPLPLTGGGERLLQLYAQTWCRYEVAQIRPITVQAMAMAAASRASPARTPEAIGIVYFSAVRL